tara:strand:+ start:208 stop:453 length:246 start_codon:yes stop_codon:yes gene_type:complete
MPVYKAKVKCFVGESLREANEEFEYNGEPNTNIEIVGGSDVVDYDAMTKAELEVYGRTIGVELDRRQTKETLINQLEAANK